VGKTATAQLTKVSLSAHWLHNLWSDSWLTWANIIARLTYCDKISNEGLGL